MSENISELKEKRSPASGVENEPLLPSDRNKLGKGKSSLLHCEGVLWAEWLITSEWNTCPPLCVSNKLRAPETFTHTGEVLDERTGTWCAPFLQTHHFIRISWTWTGILLHLKSKFSLLSKPLFWIAFMSFFKTAPLRETRGKTFYIKPPARNCSHEFVHWQHAWHGLHLYCRSLDMSLSSQHEFRCLWWNSCLFCHVKVLFVSGWFVD